MSDPLIIRAGAGSDSHDTDSQTGGPASAPPFARITVALDFSPTSLYALNLARTRFPGAQLHLVHVTDARATARADFGGGVMPAGPDPAMLNVLEGADADRLAEVVQEGEETELLVGDPVTGILNAAERWGAELIVVGTHAKGAVEHFLVGSSAEKLVARSPLPVLTVRGPA
ncbi:universal stress protein [Deinococcus hopiensis]|uniref:Nucleotide-binding universal stress protein, UspA family n=1 Tax=Deinococcus hopiensis KR-140 TaxID=695939 RepID=A0A1W1V5Z9_9DEIO|nr:universal stress protein [Deinococcus hopiensis]SMB88685.1 Nucleotide-binding universal stress protein, UspA family [Deinococcus hopiensis KR-140]